MATRNLQFVAYYKAYDTSANAYKTGDVANHSTSWVKDGTRSATTNSAAEVDATNCPGLYKVTITATESDCVSAALEGKSSTANIVLMFDHYAFDYIPNAVPGASGGLLIAGSNAATTFATLTVTGALTLTGNVLLSDGLTIAAPSTTNRAGLSITGNGSGEAILLAAGATANGITLTTTAGHGISITATGTSKHGAIITGGNGGTSDGLKLVNGTGGVGLRVSDLTITNNAIVSGTVTLSGAVQLGSTLGITGAVTLSSTLTTGAVSVTTLASSGTVTLNALTIANNFTVSGNALVTGTTTLHGAVTLDSTLTVTGATTLTGAVSLGGTLGITGTTTFAAIATGTITTTGNLSVSGTVTLTGAVTANNAGNAITGVTASLTGDLSATMKTSVQTAADAAVTANLSVIAIKAKTDGLPSDPADASDIAALLTTLTSHGDATWATATLVAITSNIKKNQALSGFEFLMSDSTTHAPATGLTVSVQRSIDGGAFANGTLSSVTEVSAGIYAVDFGAGDLNGKVITLKATATGADVTFERIVTQP